jgi:H+/Cl- antiporter ClcA
VCPNCAKPLEISLLSRYLAAFAGLIAAVVVWWAASKHYANDSWALAWVLPIVFSYFALSIVAPIVLALTADLQLRSIETASVQHDVAAPSHHPNH